MSIFRTTETRRGCGYRKEGGLYLMAGKPAQVCGKFPVPLSVCPTCHGGIKQSRGWTWFEPAPFFMDLICKDQPQVGMGVGGSATDPINQCPGCPVTHDMVLLSAALRVKAGLLWIGEGFYPTPGDFLAEGVAQGLSRRISALPKDFRVGVTRIFFAHPKAYPGWDEETGEFVDPETEPHLYNCESKGPGIFGSFVAEEVHYIVTAEEAELYELAKGMTLEEFEGCESSVGLEVDLERGTAHKNIVAGLRKKVRQGITLVLPTRVDDHGQTVDQDGNPTGEPLVTLDEPDRIADTVH